MSNQLVIKIDLTKINDAYVFKAQGGAQYLEMVMWENKNGPSQWGDTHYLTQSVPKEARDAGERGAILGNARPMPQKGQSAPRGPQSNQPQNRSVLPAPARYGRQEQDFSQAAPEDSSDIPF